MTTYITYSPDVRLVSSDTLVYHPKLYAEIQQVTHTEKCNISGVKNDKRQFTITHKTRNI